jgi:hypothetical protein
MNPLQWEHNWIYENLHHYFTVEHAERVKANISQRYYRNDLIKQIKSLRPRILK